jgi:hypothetical protein
MKLTNRRSLVGLAVAAFIAAGSWASLVSADRSPQQTVSPGPLSKAHAALEGGGNCVKCHSAGAKIDPARCLACHDPVARRIASKKGVHREVTGDCEVCHVEHKGLEVDLRPLDTKEFDHASEAGFPLTGAHAAKAGTCSACHKTRSYLGNTPACASCHADPHQGAMLESCASCHTTAGWENVNRSFHRAGTFPLEGRHLDVPCASCHWNGVVKGTPNRCYDCHWIRRQDDRYRTKLGNDCEDCHRPTSWTAVNWNHAARTGVSLNAAHGNLGCESCHKGGEFRQASFLCFSCHQEDYQEASEPNHVQAGFPTTCELCHQPSHTDWEQARFVHSGAFPLVGAHAGQACRACHANDVYKGTSPACYSCHRSDYEGTRDPNHAAAGYPTACELCHRVSDSSWDQGRDDHNVFVRVGTHSIQPCAACHLNNVYRGTPRECYGCHNDNYAATRNPNHAATGFPTSCETCHRPTDGAWTQGRFDHASAFPLVGIHATQACAACHANNVYRGTPRDCYGCHSDNYAATKTPNHAAAGYSTSCETCHRAADTSWTKSSFNHASVFALVGTHATQACAACHVNNVYRGTPRDCYGCHNDNYAATRNPNHAAAGFPTTCESCHRATDTAWTQGTFSHVWFPISSGRHSGRACSDCHPDTSNYKVFNCLGCHQKSQTDAKHQGRSGYSYASAACYGCHPLGQK